MSEPADDKRPVFFWVMVVLAGLYLTVRLVEGVLCFVSWLGWGSCPWGG